MHAQVIESYKKQHFDTIIIFVIYFFSFFFTYNNEAAQIFIEVKIKIEEN